MKNLVIQSKAAFIVDEDEWAAMRAEADNITIGAKALVYSADTAEERLEALRIWNATATPTPTGATT